MICPHDECASLSLKPSFHCSKGAKDSLGSCPNQRNIASAYPRRVRACEETVLNTSPIDDALCSMAQMIFTSCDSGEHVRVCIRLRIDGYPTLANDMTGPEGCRREAISPGQLK